MQIKSKNSLSSHQSELVETDNEMLNKEKSFIYIEEELSGDEYVLAIWDAG